MSHAIIYKRSVEADPFTMDFTDLLPGDTTLDATSEVKAFDTEGLNKTALLIQGIVALSGMTMKATIANGVNGEDYDVNFNAVGSTTKDRKNRLLEVRVRDKVAGNV